MTNTWEIREGDCLAVMPTLAPDSVDAIVTDPPYGLEFMGKDWDRLGDMSHRHASTERSGLGVPRFGSYQPVANEAAIQKLLTHRTAMQEWHLAWAREAFRVLKPGGHLVAFGGTRTFHRLACALEDAGFEIRDCLMWCYGSGFPKSLDVAKAIDKAAGAERAVVGEGPFAARRPRADHDVQGTTFADDAYIRPAGHAVTAPATDAARQWAGWGTALKPAWEPILLARKPLGERNVAANVLRHGTGGLNIDASRVAAEGGSPSAAMRASGRVPSSCKPGEYGDTIQNRITPERWQEARPGEALGRWPANVMLSHLDTCERVGTKRVRTGTAVQRNRDGEVHNEVFGHYRKPPSDDATYADADGLETVEAWRCAEGCPVAMLDAQSGERPSGGVVQGTEPSRTGDNGIYGAWGRVPNAPFEDTGGASRFFYCPKTDREERNIGFDSQEKVRYAAPTWVGEALRRVLPVDMGISLEKATVGSTIQLNDGSVWSMCWCGSPATDPFQPGLTSIIEMVASSITDPAIWNFNPKSHTNGCIAAVCAEMDAGTSLADSAARTSAWASATGISPKKAGRSTVDADVATSVKSWLTSAPGKGGGHRVKDRNLHPT